MPSLYCLLLAHSILEKKSLLSSLKNINTETLKAQDQTFSTMKITKIKVEKKKWQICSVITWLRRIKMSA
jgi:CTP-dependent riboflavin kinase